MLWLLAALTGWHALRPLILLEHAVPAVILYHVLGASFAVCGLLAFHRRPENPTGPLMVLTGFLFFVRPILISLHSSLADTVGLAIGSLWVVVFAVLLLGYPGGRRRWTVGDWWVIGALVVAEVVLVVVWMLFFWFPSNLIAFWPNARVATNVNEAAGILGFGTALALSVLLGVRWRAATPAVRRAGAPAAAGGVTLLFLAGLLLEGAFTSTQSPLLVWPTLIGLTCVPVLFLFGLLRSWRARAAVSQLLVEIGAEPGKPLQSGLARALGDPTLTLAYWLPKFASYVDGDGAPVVLPADGSGRQVAVVEQDGERVAAIVYDAALADERELLEAVCAAADIALRNERLAAELKARVSELAASRTRLISASDTERRRLERNLHDGAQQRLVALSMQLRLLTNRIRDDPVAAEALAESAHSELATSLEELRVLARGLHPAALDHGLTIALDTLVAASGVATVVEVELSDRLPEPVEVAAYFVASEALANVAKHAHATAVTIRVSHTAGEASVEISDDGVGGADDAGGSGLRGLADRVEALGGQLRIVSPVGSGTTLTAVIPCAS